MLCAAVVYYVALMMFVKVSDVLLSLIPSGLKDEALHLAKARSEFLTFQLLWLGIKHILRDADRANSFSGQNCCITDTAFSVCA